MDGSMDGMDGNDAAMTHSVNSHDMPMSFEWTLSTILWFKEWTVHSAGAYVACLVGIAIVALGHEFLANKRSQMLRVQLAPAKAPSIEDLTHEDTQAASKSR